MSKQVGGMRLEFSGAPEIAAPPEQVWQRLLDHEFVASVAPGVESVEAVDDRHFKVVSAFGVGSVKLRFRLDVELTDVRPPRRLKLAARGKAPGSAVDVTTDLEIEPVAPNRSRLKWSATSEVRGTVASVGARLLTGTAKKLTETFWQQFADRVARPSP
ncbi:MAG: carbon monoxide dehydrogenase [Gemmatimonadetes bacterium]|nr:MAG: carbon monoxide dehydrogenase [Gemmatimonadota bacterium]